MLNTVMFVPRFSRFLLLLDMNVLGKYAGLVEHPISNSGRG